VFARICVGSAGAILLCGVVFAALAFMNEDVDDTTFSVILIALILLETFLTAGLLAWSGLAARRDEIASTSD
jgi:hypothetical protein